MNLDPAGVPTEHLLRTALGIRAARKLVGVTLRELSRRGVAELTAEYGLSETAAGKAFALAELARRQATVPLARGAAFRSSRQVFDAFHQRLRDLEVEQFRVVLLDGKHRVLRECLISQGTLTSSPVHPREVFRPAIQNAAAAVVLVHNHPSGDPSPSSDDLEITRRLCEVGDLVGIHVLDHIVIGDGRYTSLADRGLMR
jgi:DNA repair protein RadC